MRILCATDLLSKSEAAIKRAGMLSDQLRAHATLLHIVVPGESERALEHMLQAARGHMNSRAQPPLWRAHRTPTVVVRPGTPGRLIVDTLMQSKPRLLVLGPHRKRSLRDTLEGTIAEKALAARTCAVLVVRNAVRTPYRRVLLALDFSDASISAIKSAESLVLTPDLDARIVHAYEPSHREMLPSAGSAIDSGGSYIAGWKRETASALRDLLEHEGLNTARYDIVVEQNQPAPGILRAIESYEPDLLIMGTRAGGRLRRALLGSVANRVLHEAACDALIVPNGTFGASRRKGLHRARSSREMSAASFWN